MKPTLNKSAILALALAMGSASHGNGQNSCSSNCGDLGGIFFTLGSCSYSLVNTICDDGVFVCSSYFCSYGTGSDYHYVFDSTCGCT